MPAFEHDDVSLAYDDTGAGGPPIVLFHGLSMSRGTWARFLPDLVDRFRVVRLDQRGHGESSHAPGTYVLDTYVADTVAFLEAVVGEASVLVGHSLGGVIAHEVARTCPELATSVLLEDPPLFVAERLGTDAPRRVGDFFPIAQRVARQMQERVAPIEDYAALFTAMPALNGSGTFADVLGPGGTRAYAEAFARLDPEIFTPAIDGSAIAWSGPERLSRPVVVLRADPVHGPAFTADDERRFLQSNPHARVVMVDGASHQIHDEQPERFLSEVLALVTS